MDLNIIVAEKTNELIENGTIEKLICEQLERTIKSGIEDALKSYSDFGREISKRIESSINLSLRHVSIPEYNNFIADVVHRQYSKLMNETAIDQLNKQISKQIIEVKKEDNITTLFNKIEEAWEGAAREADCDVIEIEHSFNDENSYLIINVKHPEYKFYNVQISLSNSKYKDSDTWTISRINADETEVTGHPLNAAGSYLESVAKIAYQYYAMQTEFTIDSDYEIEDIYLGGEYD